MNSFILDTNAILRFLLNDIPQQAEDVKNLLIKAKSKKITLFIPQIVIFEIEFALDKYYKFPKNEITDKLGSLLATSYLDIQDVEVFLEALQVFKDENIDFVDCFLLSNAKLKDINLFSFDQKLKNK